MALEGFMHLFKFLKRRTLKKIEISGPKLDFLW